VRIAAIVLAAGLSRRYGDGNKLTAPLNGKPLALHIADTLAGTAFFARIAICQPGVSLAVAFKARGFTTVENPDSTRGQASSLVLGVQAAEAAGAEAVLICLADMPFVTESHIVALLAAAETADSVASTMQGQPVPIPPAVFSRQHFPALLALQGDKGARELLASAQMIEAAAGELADFDTREDFTGNA